MDNSTNESGNDSVVMSTQTGNADIVHDGVIDSPGDFNFFYFLFSPLTWMFQLAQKMFQRMFQLGETPLSDDIKELIKVDNDVLISDVKSCVMSVLNMWPNYRGFKVTLTGSGADGTQIYTDNYQSDVDIIFVPMDTAIKEDSLVYVQELPCYVNIKSNGLNAKLKEKLSKDEQYLNAKSIKTLHQHVVQGLLKQLNVSSTKVGIVIDESAEDETLEDEQMSGPKIYSKKIHVDLVPQIELTDCPRIALEYFSRKGRSWPNQIVLNAIRTGPFHVVPRPSPVNPSEEIDFCLSFTIAELKLAESMVPHQQSCMKALKLIIHSLNESGDILTTYYIKTALYWVSETSDISIWKYDRTLKNIKKVLQFVLECISRRHLPHIFVRKANLFYGKTDDYFADVKPKINELINNESAIIKLLMRYCNRDTVSLSPDLLTVDFLCKSKTGQMMSMLRTTNTYVETLNAYLPTSSEFDLLRRHLTVYIELLGVLARGIECSVEEEIRVIKFEPGGLGDVFMGKLYKAFTGVQQLATLDSSSLNEELIMGQVLELYQKLITVVLRLCGHLLLLIGNTDILMTWVNTFEDKYYLT